MLFSNTKQLHLAMAYYNTEHRSKLPIRNREEMHAKTQRIWGKKMKGMLKLWQQDIWILYTEHMGKLQLWNEEEVHAQTRRERSKKMKGIMKLQ